MKRTYSLILFVLFITGSISKAQIDTVQIETGLITGTFGKDSTVHVYKGIPYAAPPVGDLRWKPPQPLSNWNGVYKADSFACACMQNPPQEGSFYQKEFYQKEEPVSEDCLYLNVWTAAKSSKEQRPVMVWIHGGSFSQGSGSMPSFNGEAFAKEGVVLVTINYRLGIFGLFAHPELTRESGHNSSGNYGLLDQTAALKWIRRNIKAFGGDPDNITLFGQSSGAGNINKLMASPLTKGLFQKAILQSGSAYTFGETQLLEEAEQDGIEFANKFGINSIEELRDWTSSELLEKGSKYAFKPNIDGWFLPDEVFTIFENGDQHKMPVLAGSNADEGNTLFGPKLNAEIFKNIIKRGYGEDADAFLKLYPHKTDREARSSFNKAWRDEMAWGVHTFAKMHNNTSDSNTWLYYFSKVPPGRNSQRYGAFHSAEIVYVFNTLDTVDRPWSELDNTLAHKMLKYWVNFASNGNPNGTGLTTWPEYNPSHRKVLEFGKDIETRVILEKDILEFYDSRFNKKYE